MTNKAQAQTTKQSAESKGENVLFYPGHRNASGRLLANVAWVTMYSLCPLCTFTVHVPKKLFMYSLSLISLGLPTLGPVGLHAAVLRNEKTNGR